MKGFYTIKWKSLFFIVLATMLLHTSEIFAQVSPYSLTPEWRFGARAGLSFPNGDFPTSGGPAVTPLASNPATESVEASTSISDTSETIALYTNTIDVRNITNAVVRDLAVDNTCGGSATGGSVMVPDPSSPTNTYYLFIANDVTGGTCGNQGINYYRFRKNAMGQTVYLAGPTNIATNPGVDESICAGSDGQGNYWIASHDQATNNFKIWSVTAGGVTARANQAIGPNGVTNGNSTIKISPCQDKIAWHGGTQLVVYNFNRLTGAIGAQLGAWNTATHGIGLEFSPNGNTLFVSGMGTGVQWYTIGG